MNIDVLRTFIAVAEYKNYTKASEMLFISQPTISRQIMKLEDELGVVLLNRNKRKISLTKEGTIFFEEALEIVNRYDDFVEKMKDLKNGFFGDLIIGYTGNLGYNMLVKSLKRICSRHPNVNFSVIENESIKLIKQLETNNVDLIFTLEAGLDNYDFISYKKVAKNSLKCLVSKEHPLSNRGKICFSNIIDEKIVLPPREVNPFFVDNIFSLFYKIKALPNNISYGRIQDMLLLVESNRYVALTSSEMRPQNLNRIVALDIEENIDGLDLVIAWSRNNMNSNIPLFINEIDDLIVEKLL